MKIIVFGGAGAEGRAMIRNLVVREEVDSVVIGDIDEEAAQKFADKLGSEKLSVHKVDVLDPAGLHDAIGDADVVANLIAPQSKFTMPVVKGALKARVHYVDIGADWRLTEEVLALDGEVKEAGVTCLLGIGVSPGISNLLVKYGSAQLAGTDEVKVVWVAPAPPLLTPSGEWVEAASGGTMEDFIEACTGEVPTFAEGMWIKIPSLVIGEYFDFPPPLGRYRAYHVGHLEPLTIPRFLPGVRTVGTFGALYPQVRNDEMRFMIRNGPKPPGSDEFEYAGGLQVTVEGTDEDGRRVKYTYDWAPDITSMAAQTAVPCALAAVWLASGRIARKGVVAAEACIEPVEFFEDLADHYTKTMGSYIEFEGDFTVDRLMVEKKEIF